MINFLDSFKENERITGLGAFLSVKTTFSQSTKATNGKRWEWEDDDKRRWIYGWWCTSMYYAIITISVVIIIHNSCIHRSLHHQSCIPMFLSIVGFQLFKSKRKIEGITTTTPYSELHGCGWAELPRSFRGASAELPRGAPLGACSGSKPCRSRKRGALHSIATAAE